MNADTEVPAQVFISYSRVDGVFVYAFAESLLNQGVKVLIDRNEIVHSEDWRRRISGMIAAADVVFVVASPDLVRSQICRWEAEQVLQFGKRAVPIFFRDADGGGFPINLGGYHGIQVRQLGQGFASVLRAHDSGSESAAAQAAQEFRSWIATNPHFVRLVEHALQALRAPDALWRRRQSEWSQRAASWEASGRSTERLLRSGEAAEARAWWRDRPGGENVLAPLLTTFFDQSERHEAAVAEERRRIVLRSFVEPARRAANDGQHDSAIRRIAAGLILSEDPTFSLDRETPEPHKNALWKIAATSAPHATKRVVRWELRGLPYLISISGATSIALSPCGRFLAGSALCGGHPRIWSTETWEVVAVLEHDYAPGNVFWLKAPNLILTFGGNHQTALWRGDDFSFVRTVGEFRAGDICVSEGSRILFQSSSGATVCWDLIAGAKVSEFPGDYGVIKAIALSADGEVAASPGIDRSVRIWRTRDGAELRRIEPVSKMIDNEAVFLPGGKRVLVRSLGGVVRNCSVDPSSDPPDQQWEQKGLDVFPSIRGSDTCIAGDESGLVTLRDALTG